LGILLRKKEEKKKKEKKEKEDKCSTQNKKRDLASPSFSQILQVF
jgi:hypothetical protein